MGGTSEARSSASSSNRPVVAIVTDRIDLQGHAAYSALAGYVRSVSEAAGALPLLLPAATEAIDRESLLASIDGIVLTGSPSNVAPERYGGSPLLPGALLDRDRDALVLPLIPLLEEAGIPILGVCRGLQEINVAHGGTLNTAVHEQPGRLDHREGDHARPVQRWYDDSHAVKFAAGGVLSRLAGCDGAQVNSLHHQGVERLGDGLRIEATAPDGLIEAFSLDRANRFVLAVQWHPEMRIDDDALAWAIFSEFGDACRRRRMERLAEAVA